MDKAIEKLNELILDRDKEFLALFGKKNGSDSLYLEWLKFQSCKSCGKVPSFVMSTFYHNVPCHVRRVSAGSGTGIKPPWNATTMCDAFLCLTWMPANYCSPECQDLRPAPMPRWLAKRGCHRQG